ncbi:MAG: excinuclease ABC subunit UvrB [Clostridiaceae bacterium]|jgi:excinuclease ABC subunit B|nr:excinuclease ABC subunit UvrB [Clostridiaceae bacterium]
MNKFELVSKFKPTGDQPDAIARLTRGLNDGLRMQVLLGVTGSGKTFTMANVIQEVQRPALIIAHNKILAAQLCNEFREFFPKNRVEFFVSYYDYYQPEAYIPRSDTYIEKDLAINDEIDKLRHSATSSLFESRDVIVVASVSCIYGLGAPEEYFRQSISLRPGAEIDRDELLRKLVDIQYKRADIDFQRSTFRVRGDTVDIFPAANSEIAVRLEFFGDEIERILEFDALTGKVLNELKHSIIFPASHYVVGGEHMEAALKQIRRDKELRVEEFREKNKLIEAQRIDERVNYDIEMIREMGYCSGIENYSRYFDGRAPGTPPYTLLDFFPKDFIVFADESHMTLPQIRGMFNGDKSRKINLVDYGFRLPAAFDNRPLNFEEFDARIGQIVCVSATPGPYEMSVADDVSEQLIRPTGLIDPEVSVRPIEGQIDDLTEEIRKTAEVGGKVLVTTLTKRMAESLTDFLRENGVKVKYLHSDIETLERIKIVSGLRSGEFDVLVGINLLREGLDLPEVRLVAILDADKEGFLRSETSLIQTIGRAARNIDGKVVMYADVMTDSMKRAISETNRRRRVQTEYNEEHDITPQSIQKEIINTIRITQKVDEQQETDTKTDKKDVAREIERLKGAMQLAADSLDFELAIRIRDRLAELRKFRNKK